MVLAFGLHRAARGVRLRARRQPGRGRTRAGRRRRHLRKPERPGAEPGRLPSAGDVVSASGHAIKRLVAAGSARADARRDRRIESRSGFLGLLAMALVLGVYMVDGKPAIAVRRRARLLCAAGRCRSPSGTAWTASRTPSRTTPDRARRGSADGASRCRCSCENPLTGIGAGQFKNYEPRARDRGWRVTHNVVAAGRGGTRHLRPRVVRFPGVRGPSCGVPGAAPAACCRPARRAGGAHPAPPDAGSAAHA